MTPNYAELFQALLPEAALVIGVLLVLGFDLIAGARHSLERTGGRGGQPRDPRGARGRRPRPAHRSR